MTLISMVLQQFMNTNQFKPTNVIFEEEDDLIEPRGPVDIQTNADFGILEDTSADQHHDVSIMLDDNLVGNQCKGKNITFETNGEPMVKPVIIGNLNFNWEGLDIDGKLNMLLSTQNTLVTLMGTIYINQENIRHDLSTLSTNVGVLQTLLSNNSQNEVLEVLSEFPIEEDSALIDFNKKLADTKYKTLMASALKFSVGTCNLSIQKNVNAMMGKLFSDKLLKKYSSLGIREKQSFCEFTSICELIWTAISLTFSGKPFKESVKDILQKMGNNMKHAPSRIKSTEAKAIKKKEIQKDV